MPAEFETPVLNTDVVGGIHCEAILSEGNFVLIAKL